MASTAISAQGSTLSVASATAPSPVNLSGATIGTVTTFTSSAAHGLVDGAQVVLASLTGTGASLLNGKTLYASVLSTTTFSVQVDTTSLTVVASSGTVTGTNYVQINNLKTYNGLDGQASEIDVTNLSSSAKEIRLGLVDYGQIQLELDHDSSDAGQARALALYKSGAASPFVLSLPNGDTAAFVAFTRKFSLQGGVDQVVKRSLDLRISGPVTWC